MKEKERAQEERRKQYSVVANEPNDEEPGNDIVEAQDLEGSVVCPECGTNGPGIITSEIPIAVYVVVTILIMVVGKWAFLIAPFLFLLINSQIRTCNHCGHVIEQKTQFSVKSVNEQVYTMKFSGDLVIVISKRYAMIIGSVIILIALSIFTYEEFFASSSVTEINRFSKDRKDHSTWTDYIEQCGSQRIKANEFRTDNLFNGRFRNTKIEWEGYVYGTDPINRAGNILKGIRIKMDPTDSQDFDLLLLTSDSLEPTVANLKEGHYIKFGGLLKFIGNEEYPHIVDTEHIELPTKTLDMEQVKKLPQYQFKKTGRLFGGKL